MNRKRSFSALLVGGLIAVGLMTAFLRTRYQLDQALESQRLRSSLNLGASAIEQDLDAARVLLDVNGHTSSSGRWHGWRLDATHARYQGGYEPPFSSALLKRELEQGGTATNSGVLFGPLATDTGSDALVIAKAVPIGGGRDYIGAWKSIDEFVQQPSVLDAIKQGYRIQLYELGRPIALYQSDRASFSAREATAIRFGSSTLLLRGAVQNRWATLLALASPLLLMLLVFALWLSYELRCARAFEQADSMAAEAEAQRKALNCKYERALENIGSLEARLQMSCLYDTATGLANRSSLLRTVEMMLDAIRETPGKALWLLTVGIDQIPRLASSFGADFSARAMVAAVQRLQPLLPAPELLFRIGDEHLTVVLPEGQMAQVQELAQSIIERMGAPITIDTHTLLLHPSIGITQSATGYEGAQTLLDQADAALAAAHLDAHRRWCLFDSATVRQSARRLQLEADLGRALDEGQLVLEYEPFVLPAAHTVVGFEALIRWQHPTEGRLTPGVFLPIAEQAGLMPRIDSWVMREAARQASAWRRGGHREVFVNFNLSAEAFVRPDLANTMSSLLDEFELPGSQLIIELTESALLRDVGAAARTLKELNDLGVGAWLDDFGTGYSSLSHLRALPLKGVKLDRSFIERVEIEARDFGLLKALIDLISYLGMHSIAEGIETAAQCELLSLTTCDLYQGHFFSHSMPAAQAEHLLREGMALGKARSDRARPADQHDGHLASA